MKTSASSDLLLLSVTVLSALGWIFSKEALFHVAPLSFIGIRFLLAGLLLALFCVPQLKQMTATQWRKAIGLGSFFSLAIMVWMHGLFYCQNVGEGAFITSLAVVVVPVFARFFFAEQPAPSTWVAIPIAGIGLAFLSLNSGFHFENAQWLFLMAALIFSIHFNLNTKISTQIPAFPLTAIQLTTVGLVALTLAGFRETQPFQIPQHAWLWVLASILIASAARFVIQTQAQSMATASDAAIIMILEPIWTTLIAWFWFEERMTGLQWLGCSFIFLALLINRWRMLQLFIKNRLYKTPSL